MSQQKGHPRWGLTKEFAGHKGKSCEGSEVRGLGESRTQRNLAWLDQEREGGGRQEAGEVGGRLAHVSTGGAVLQPASPLTTPGDTLPHFPSRVRHSRPVSQPPVHSQRRLSPHRLLRSCSSSAAQTPSACSLGPASSSPEPGRKSRLTRATSRACVSAGSHPVLAAERAPSRESVSATGDGSLPLRHQRLSRKHRRKRCREAAAWRARRPGSRAAGSLGHTHPFHAFPSPLLSRSVAAVDRGMRRQSNNVQTGLCFRSENQGNRKTRVRPGTER